MAWLIVMGYVVVAVLTFRAYVREMGVDNWLGATLYVLAGVFWPYSLTVLGMALLIIWLEDLSAKPRDWSWLERWAGRK